MANLDFWQWLWVVVLGLLVVGEWLWVVVFGWQWLFYVGRVGGFVCGVFIIVR